MDLANINLVVTDCDGVLTDGGIYYGDKGNTMRKFNTLDGKGFELLNKMGISTAIISSEQGVSKDAIIRRANKMKVDFCDVGVEDKVDKVLEYLDLLLAGSSLKTAYIGNGISDIEAMDFVKYSYYPQDAHYSVSYVDGSRMIAKDGGEGVILELASFIAGDRRGDEWCLNL